MTQSHWWLYRKPSLSVPSLVHICTAYESKSTLFGVFFFFFCQSLHTCELVNWHLARQTQEEYLISLFHYYFWCFPYDEVIYLIDHVNIYRKVVAG